MHHRYTSVFHHHNYISPTQQTQTPKTALFPQGKEKRKYKCENGHPVLRLNWKISGLTGENGKKPELFNRNRPGNFRLYRKNSLLKS